MPKPAKPTKPPHPRYNPSQPLLRELVLVSVTANDGAWFNTLLTRVPGLGEEIIQEGDIYKVVRVQHDRVNDDGRAYLGNHAYAYAELQAEDLPMPRLPQKSNPRKKPKKRKRRSRASNQSAEVAKLPPAEVVSNRRKNLD